MTLTALDERTALVVIDLQNGLLDAPTTPHSVPDVVGRAVALADAFRSRNLPVILVRVTIDGSGFAPGRTEVGRAVRARPEGWDHIVDDLAGHPADIVVTKRNPGAFHGTDLDLHLRRRGITQIVLAGIATTMGVEATARAAYEHGYHVSLVTDAMTDLDPDAHHNSVTRIFPRIGETVTTAEVLDMLEKTHG